MFGGHDLLGDRGVRGDHAERGAVEGVRAGREDRDGTPGGVLGTRTLGGGALDHELHVSALGTADPVALHGQHTLGPMALQLAHVVEQALGVVGDLEVPLVQGLLGHGGVAAFARAVDHLLVGEHRLVLGAPVDRGVLPVGQPVLVELQEQPLRPAVVLGVGGVDLPVPVHADRVALERRALGVDVAVGPLGGVGVTLDGGVLRRQAEGVPADRVHHVVAAVQPVAGDHVPHGEGLRVAHVQVPRGVGEHVQDVTPRSGIVVPGREDPVVLPVAGPGGLDALDVVVRARLRGAVLAHVPRLQSSRGWAGDARPPRYRRGDSLVPRSRVGISPSLDQPATPPLPASMDAPTPHDWRTRGEHLRRTPQRAIGRVPRALLVLRRGQEAQTVARDAPRVPRGPPRTAADRDRPAREVPRGAPGPARFRALGALPGPGTLGARLRGVRA